MKRKLLLLSLLATLFVSCGKPTIDQQIERLAKAYEQNDCDRIRDIYLDLSTRDESEFTEEQSITLFAIMIGGKCDCDLDAISEEIETAIEKKKAE
ncbi:MAG: hypothetical protein ACI3Z5_07935 [Paludibacteraceae bacterium]